MRTQKDNEEWSLLHSTFGVAVMGSSGHMIGKSPYMQESLAQAIVDAHNESIARLAGNSFGVSVPGTNVVVVHGDDGGALSGYCVICRASGWLGDGRDKFGARKFAHRTHELNCALYQAPPNPGYDILSA